MIIPSQTSLTIICFGQEKGETSKVRTGKMATCHETSINVFT